MRQIRSEKLTVAEANQLLRVEMEPGFWAALVRIVNYPELTYDAAGKTIAFPSYVPFEQLAREFLQGVEHGLHDLRRCLRCKGTFEVGRDDGIFAKPAEMEDFLCLRCAESITAREFYEKYM
ncbi:MAG: hypothetical protein MUE73_07800 [Planctomycetes bacterium]|jgi:hypothetical protein|nr:hypothetical protein [Planctomycetota bacterium]